MYRFAQTKSGWIWDFGLETIPLNSVWLKRYQNSSVWIREYETSPGRWAIAEIPREIYKMGLKSYFAISILFAQVVDSKNPNKSNGFCLIPARKSTIPIQKHSMREGERERESWIGWIPSNAARIQYSQLQPACVWHTIYTDITYPSITNRTFQFQLLPKIQLNFCISIEMRWKWLKTVAGYCILQILRVTSIKRLRCTICVCIWNKIKC